VSRAKKQEHVGPFCTCCRAKPADVRNSGLCTTCGVRGRRAVVWLLYYVHGCTMREIASLFNVTPGRIWQIVQMNKRIMFHRALEAGRSRELWAVRLRAANAIPSLTSMHDYSDSFKHKLPLE
jgi:hypothetical protein